MIDREEEELQSETLAEMASAELHVHFLCGIPEISVCSDRVTCSVELTPAALQVVLLALRSNVEYACVGEGNGEVQIQTEGDATGAPGDVIVVAIAHRAAGFSHRAMIARGELIRRLTDGCSKTPSEKCASPAN